MVNVVVVVVAVILARPGNGAGENIDVDAAAMTMMWSRMKANLSLARSVSLFSQMKTKKEGGGQVRVSHLPKEA